LNQGDKVGGYLVRRREPVDHLQATYYELVHESTGARHIHIEGSDDNHTFMVLFPTVPQDSTGVAHILEHCVLSGSKRFPVKDPFNSMWSRSLKTFMNAFTGEDATFYPFSTRNEKDFFNLLNVYLDAVFFPNLEERALKQEGHRLEFEQLEDPSSGLRFKGVVFNEMKAVLASPGAVVAEAIGDALYPDLTYAFNSGGDPEVMPNLTWEQLKEFHRVHYDPSNSFFYTYGSLPLPTVLDVIEDQVLSKFKRIDVHINVGDQKNFDSPKEFKTSYPLSRDEDPSKKTQVLIGWKTVYVGNSFELLSLSVLKEVLLSNAASPLRKALIDSGLGDALADGTGLHAELREAAFCAGLKNVREEDAEKVEQLVLDTLRSLAEQGLEEEQIDAAIHQYEIDNREVSNAGFPFSMKVFFSLVNAYVYGGDPYRSLRFDQDIEQLETERKRGRFFEDLIRRYLLDNPHRVRIVVTPDQELDERREKSELARLAEIESKLSDDEKRRIVEETRALKELQEADQDLSVLPTLELTDVPMTFEDVPHTIEDVAGARVGFFPQPTNGLTYVDIRLDYSALHDRLRDRLPLFAYAVPRMGAGKYDYVEMAKRVDSYTGGIGLGASIRPVASGNGSFLQPLVLSGKALARNHRHFVEILRDFLADVSFDPKRLKELIAELAAQRQAQVAIGGTHFAILLAASKLSPAGLMEERLGGLAQIAVLKEAAKLESVDEVVADLEEIQDLTFRRDGIQICVTTEEKNFDEMRTLFGDAFSSVKGGDGVSLEEVPAAGAIRHEARTIASQVAFNVKLHKTVTYSHEDAPALTVLSHFLMDNFMHRELREKGGAYGGFAIYDREKGFFFLCSNRDPNIVRTYEVFDAAAREAIKGDIDPEKLREAILTSCGDVDPLMSPDTKGRRRFFNDIAGYTLDLQERFKKGLLNVKEEDLRRVAETYLTSNDAVLATVGGAHLIEEANKQMGGIFEVAPV
jgi:Zn-dependent M16 (insulinase) family peptidase